MGLFRFRFVPVETIAPWGEGEARSLSLFALSFGEFWIDLGDAELFRYAPAVLADGAEPDGRLGQYAEYQVLAFAREVLACVPAALEPLPEPLARLVSDGPHRLNALVDASRDLDARSEDETLSDQAYRALRWLGERSPWMGQLVEAPQFSFLRTGDHLHIVYDNRRCRVDERLVWTADVGQFVMPVARFLEEVHSFRDELVRSLGERVEAIASGRAKPEIPVDVEALRVQHARWSAEFEQYLTSSHTPDIPWDVALADFELLRRRLL